MIELLILSVFPLAMVIAAVSDFLSMTISNRLCLLFAGAFFAVAVAAGMEPWVVLMHLSAGFAMLVLGFSLFSLGWIGGGDAKFFAATAIWLGWAQVFEYALWASIAGGALTMVMLAARAWPLPAGFSGTEWAERLHDPKHGVPYGIALAIAGLLVFPATPWFQAVLG